jgi:hypothetical protein
MEVLMAGDPNAQIAADIQSKFEFYFIGLIFTLLGLAIQTSKSTVVQSVAVCETLSWIALLIAGLIGIKRIIFIPVVMHGFAAIKRVNLEIDQIEANRHTTTHVEISGVGERLTHDDAIRIKEDGAKKVDARNKKTNQMLVCLFKAQYWLFIAALILLIYSRGYENIQLIYKFVCSSF